MTLPRCSACSGWHKQIKKKCRLRRRYDDFVFGKDVFLKTDHPIATDSKDDWSPEDQKDLYSGMPLSFVVDFWSGAPMARCLLEMRPGKDRLLDLGTATGSVPLTMRTTGMRALGLDGLDVGKRGLVTPKMLQIGHPSLGNSGESKSERFAWTAAPELVDCCDITKPFSITDGAGARVLFDYVVSNDCFEHLVTDRVPQLVDNIYEHLADDGILIFVVCTGEFYGIHQTVKPRKWWAAEFSRRFVVDGDASKAEFPYIRLRPDGTHEPNHEVFWARKRGFTVRPGLICYTDSEPGENATMVGPHGAMVFRMDESSFSSLAGGCFTWAFGTSRDLIDGDEYVFSTSDRTKRGLVSNGRLLERTE